MSYPERASGVCAPLDLASMGALHFAPPDSENFPLLPLAYRAIEAGGALPAVLNAANEVAVAAFLAEKLSFLGIGELVGKTVEKLFSAQKAHALEEILNYDKEARRVAAELLSEK
jgi:1-deoxy-D-xylulose-5-phosphate reductoisomerase